MSKRPIHLPNLNALRFLAAFSVILFHVEHKKTLFNLSSMWGKSYFLTTIGYHAVTFFFVLSGYLITYLLLNEKSVHGYINIRKFWARRVLRIFPVYFLTIIFGLFVLPNLNVFYVPSQTETLINNFWSVLALSWLFLSNVAFAIYGNLACIDQTWSVSSEEQFYLIWPFVIYFSSRKILPYVLVSIIVIGILGKIPTGSSVINTLFYLNRFGCMAIGALGALLISNMSSVLLKLIKGRKVFTIAVVVICILLTFDIFPSFLHFMQPEIYSIFFCIIIIGISVGEAKRLPLDGGLFRYLGNLSYSSYMYHNAFVALGCNLLISFAPRQNSLFLTNLFLYSFVIISTFIMSWASYKYMEMPILKLKKNHSVVITAP